MKTTFQSVDINTTQVHCPVFCINVGGTEDILDIWLLSTVQEKSWGIDAQVVPVPKERLNSIFLFIDFGNVVKPGCKVWKVSFKLITGQITKVQLKSE